MFLTRRPELRREASFRSSPSKRIQQKDSGARLASFKLRPNKRPLTSGSAKSRRGACGRCLRLRRVSLTYDLLFSIISAVTKQGNSLDAGKYSGGAAIRLGCTNAGTQFAFWARVATCHATWRRASARTIRSTHRSLFAGLTSPLTSLALQIMHSTPTPEGLSWKMRNTTRARAEEVEQSEAATRRRQGFSISGGGVIGARTRDSAKSFHRRAKLLCARITPCATP